MTGEPIPVSAEQTTVQDRPPNFREDGRLYLVRCFACSPKYGRENWAPAVASGYCSFCNWPNGESPQRTDLR